MTPFFSLMASGPSRALGSPRQVMVVGEPRLVTQSGRPQVLTEHPHLVLVGA